MSARKGFSPFQRLKVFEAAGGVCHICEQKIHVGQKWEVEHIRPLSLLGTNDGDNLAPAHVACHAGKTAGDVAANARAKRRKAKMLGIRKASSLPGGRNSKWKRKITGEVVMR